MDLFVQLLNQSIDIIEVYFLTDVGQNFGCPVWHFGWVKQRTKYNSASVLSYFFIFPEKFLLNVLIFGFFSGEGIKKAYYDEPISVEACDLGKVAFEFFDLKLSVLIDGKVSSDKERFEFRIVIDYSQPFGQKF